MKDSLLFAQLSDPHLTTLEHVAWHDLINKRVLGYLSWRRRRRNEHRSEVLDALQQDLRRADIEPFAWVINQSLTPLDVRDPVLVVPFSSGAGSSSRNSSMRSGAARPVRRS